MTGTAGADEISIGKHRHVESLPSWALTFVNQTELVRLFINGWVESDGPGTAGAGRG